MNKNLTGQIEYKNVSEIRPATLMLEKKYGSENLVQSKLLILSIIYFFWDVTERVGSDQNNQMDSIPYSSIYH